MRLLNVMPECDDAIRSNNGCFDWQAVMQNSHAPVISNRNVFMVLEKVNRVTVLSEACPTVGGSKDNRDTVMLTILWVRC